MLSLFSMEKSAFFLGAKPEIKLELGVRETVWCRCHEGGWVAGECHCNGKGWTVECKDSPRFVVPPLKMITIRGTMVAEHRARLEALKGVQQIKFVWLYKNKDIEGTVYYNYEY